MRTARRSALHGHEDVAAWDAQYSEVARRYDIEQLGVPDWRRPYLRRLRRYARLPEVHRVLEFGSGKGGLSLAIKLDRPDLDVFCLDFSGVALQFSQAAFAHHRTKANFVCGSFLELPFASGTFDLVHGNTVLEHVEDTELALSELTRVLRPGGILLATVPNRRRRIDGHDIYVLVNRLDYLCQTFAPSRLRQLVQAAGHEILEEFGAGALYIAPSWLVRAPWLLLQRWRRGPAASGAYRETAPVPLRRRRPIGAAVSAARNVARLADNAVWLPIQARVNDLVDHRELLPASVCLAIGIVARKR